MYLILKVFYYFFIAWCSFVFSFKYVTKFQYAAYSLFQATFRIPQSERADVLLVLKKYINLCKALFFKSKNWKAPYVLENSDGILMYDVLRSNYADRKEYVEYFSKARVSGGIFKEELYQCNFGLHTFFVFLLSSILLPFLFLSSLFKKDKAPHAIVFRDFVETINLLKICKALNIKTLYFFCMYEKDANLCTLLLSRMGINVNKITSETPLNLWNRVIIADELYICSGYQLDELKENAKSVFVSSVHLWGPEKIMNNIAKYQNPQPTVKKTIGFYSTGGWIRKLENHMEQKTDLEKMEEMVKNVVKKICVDNPEYSLIVFLHPREKWDKYSKLTSDKYQKDFEGISFSLEADSSANTFEKADLGVAFLSTIVFERLYFGFKTIMMPIGLQEIFPSKESHIKNICASSETELQFKITENANLTNQDFFESNQIAHFAKYLYN